jgi:hypothetical protein
MSHAGPLLEIIDATDTLSGLFAARETAEEQRTENRYDRDYDQQFDQCKPGSTPIFALPMRLH